MVRVSEREARAAEFFDTLFEASDIIEIRRFPSKRQEWTEASNLAHLAVADTEDVYFGANPRSKRGGSKAEDVPLARCVFVDFDHVSAPQQAETLIRDAGLSAPTVTVVSGRGVHAYWRLAEPLSDLAEWNAVQRGLIAALGTDKAIHDPPRIMRVPGSINTKNGAACRVVTIRDAWYALDEFPRDAKPAPAERPMFPPAKEPQNVARRTLLFLRHGASEGNRNGELFAAACDLAGCGYVLSEIESELVPVAERCGLTAAEAVQSIRSACSKLRNPSRPPPVDIEAVWPQPKSSSDDGCRGMTRSDEGEQSSETPSEITPADGLPPLSNVFEAFEEKIAKGKDGSTTAKTERRLVYKSAPLITAEMIAATNGWPKLVGDRPFIMVGTGLNQRPHLFRGASDLFGWMHSRAGLFWTEAKCTDRQTRAERTAVGKAEVYEYLRLSPEVDRYTSVSVYPHHPPIGGMFYPPLNLPEATGEHLDKFISMLNPDTPEDRLLLTSLILTPGAGLAPGTRPLFVLTSDAGQGAGKTATARAIADIWGGSCDLNYTEDWADLSKRIMSSDDAFSRVMLFDNVKGSTFGTGTLESAITSKTITGWKSYVGQVSRPNDATFVVTFNDPALTRDLTDRAVVIKIGTQRHSFDFVTWAQDYVAANRQHLLADALAMLRAEPAWSLSDDVDRFQAWQKAVLTRIPGASDLGRLIVERRASVDADGDSAAELVEALRQWCEVRDTNEITGIELANMMVEFGLFAPDKGQSDSQNKANATKRAKRILAGRSMLKAKLDEFYKTPVYRVVVNDAGKRTRTPIFSVNLANTGHDAQDLPDDELPI